MKRRSITALTVLLACLLLAGCGKKNESPASYTVGEDEVVSLDSVMDEGAALLASIETPTSAAIEQGLEIYTYKYRQAEDPAKLASSYIKVLQGEEQGFVIVDTENRQTEEEPDYERLTGSVILGRAATSKEEDAPAGTFRVIVAWSEFNVAVQVSRQEGTILPPLEPEPEATTGSGDVGATAMSEQLEHFNTLSPSLLGLPGNSMSEYRVYPVDGWVRVNGISCRQLNVYLLDMPESTNTFLGTYYLSSDLQQLYQKTDTGEIISVDMG